MIISEKILRSIVRNLLSEEWTGDSFSEYISSFDKMNNKFDPDIVPSKAFDVYDRDLSIENIVKYEDFPIFWLPAYYANKRAELNDQGKDSTYPSIAFGSGTVNGLSPDAFLAEYYGSRVAAGHRDAKAIDFPGENSSVYKALKAVKSSAYIENVSIENETKQKTGKHYHVELTKAKLTDIGEELVIEFEGDYKDYFNFRKTVHENEFDNAPDITKDFINLFAAMIEDGQIDHTELIQLGDISRDESDQANIMYNNVVRGENATPGDGLGWLINTYKNLKMSSAVGLAILGDHVEYDTKDQSIYLANIVRAISTLYYFATTVKSGRVAQAKKYGATEFLKKDPTAKSEKI